MSSCSPIKVGEDKESIFNNLIYVVVKKVVPILREIGLSPNDLTTISIFFAYLSYKNLIKKDKSCIVYYIVYDIRLCRWIYG